jgi:hypothetical protein
VHRHDVGSPQPQGPRSCPSYAVSSRHYLVDPIRPTRGHIAFSPHGGLYAMPSLCGSAEATHKWFRAFAIHSVLAYRPLRPRGFDHRQFQRSDVDAAFAESGPARHSQNSRNPFHAGDDFRGFLVYTSATVCQFARALHGSDRLPRQRGFYIRAFSGLVALP